MSAFVLWTAPRELRGITHAGGVAYTTRAQPGHMTFVGASAPGTAIAEVAQVKDAVHFASEAAAQAYVAARVATKAYRTSSVTVAPGIAVVA